MTTVCTVTTESHCGLIPVHTARMSLTMAEARVDYMSSCILLGRASQLVVTGRDSWKGLQLAGLEGNRAEANIQVEPLDTCCEWLTYCAGTSRAVVGPSTISHTQNYHKISDEYCAEDPRLHSAAETTQRADH